jgi:hypothetical protein
MQLTTSLFTRQTLVVLVLIGFAALILFSRLGQVESAVQSTGRTFENKVPAHVPLEIKLRKDKEARVKDANNKSWTRDIQIDITNTSDKPIYLFTLFLELPDIKENGATMVFEITFGRTELVDETKRPRAEDKPLLPKETYTYQISDKLQHLWEDWKKVKHQDDTLKLEVQFQYLSFGDGTGFHTRQGVPFPAKQDPEA